MASVSAAARLRKTAGGEQQLGTPRRRRLVLYQQPEEWADLIATSMKLADLFLVAIVDDRLYFMGGDYHFDGDAAGQTSSSTWASSLTLASEADLLQVTSCTTSISAEARTSRPKA